MQGISPQMFYQDTKTNNMLNMEVTKIINILEQRGYDPRSAQLVAGELLLLSSPLNMFFEAWLSDESRKYDFESHGYSISSLMKDRQMTYPAALLTIDWLVKEPANALKSLKKGIK